MGRSYRVPRRRPRVRSVNFGPLWWLLRREAALRVLYFDVMGTALEYEGRLQIAEARADKLGVAVKVALATQAHRQWYPTAYGVDGVLSTPTDDFAAEQVNGSKDDGVPF